MTTTLSALSRRPGDPPTEARRQTLGRAIKSEWIKIRTLRTTWIGMGAMLLVLVGFAALAAAMSTGSVEGPHGGNGEQFDSSDPLSTVLSGADFAVLLVGILGSLAGAREYSSRMITASIAAVPRRWQVVFSKAVVFAAVVAITAVIGVFAAFWVGMAILEATDGATVALSDDGVARQVLGMAGYITGLGIIGLGLGIIMRSVAGSIGAVVGGVLILPPLAGALLPDSWDVILQYLPSSAAAAFTVVRDTGTEVLSVGAGIAVFIAWVLAVMAAAMISITRRDV